MKLRILLSAVALAVAGCASAHAQTGQGLPIMVVADDESQSTVVRSSEIHATVIRQIQRRFADYDYFVIDEHAVAGEFDWEMRNRRPKSELFQMVDLACTAGRATLCPRVLVTMKVRAVGNDRGFATELQLRMSGEIFDAANNAFITSWDAEPMTFPGPAECSAICTETIISDNARDIAVSVGTVLREKLAYLDRGAAQADYAIPDADRGLTDVYLFTFREFERDELDAITEVMETEFPHYVQVRGVSGDTTVYKYNYETRADSDELFRWTNILLRDMGFLDHEYRVTLRSDNEFTVEKVMVDRGARDARSGRFQ